MSFLSICNKHLIIDIIKGFIVCPLPFHRVTARISVFGLRGPFKCYVMQWGVSNFQAKCYEGVLFNVISITREWVGVKFPEKIVM